MLLTWTLSGFCCYIHLRIIKHLFAQIHGDHWCSFCSSMTLWTMYNRQPGYSQMTVYCSVRSVHQKTRRPYSKIWMAWWSGQMTGRLKRILSAPCDRHRRRNHQSWTLSNGLSSNPVDVDQHAGPAFKLTGDICHGITSQEGPLNSIWNSAWKDLIVILKQKSFHKIAFYKYVSYTSFERPPSI